MNYDDPPEGHPDYYDYYDYNYTGDWGWDTDPKVKVPGFGFVPAKVDAKLNAMTQVRDDIQRLQIERLFPKLFIILRKLSLLINLKALPASQVSGMSELPKVSKTCNNVCLYV